MISDKDGELESPIHGARLPSLLALRCFEAAARLEHFSRAADELHLTHGAAAGASTSPTRGARWRGPWARGWI